MKIEEGWEMYYRINDLKKSGYSKAQISKKLFISRPTIIKYYDMDINEYEKCMESKKIRLKKTDKHEDEIVAMIRKYPDFSSAQVYDRLLEKYLELDYCESALRLNVRRIRDKYCIPKISSARIYEMVDELPMGQQMQVDFGEIRVQNSTGKTLKIYVISFVLSHSRYKYCQWQTRSFTTLDTIMAHENAFEYFGGIPQEAVYDQDHLILVSENHGNLIFTAEFAKYLKTRNFKVYMCRKKDPESKGKIENVVKYVKYNFAKYRIFNNLEKWNEECLRWLERRGNSKLHETTKKVPAEVFLEEIKHMNPFSNKLQYQLEHSTEYQVRKNNVVPINGNWYSVPLGTYKGPDTYVNVEITDVEVVITDKKTGLELHRCNIPATKGNLCKNTDHKRDKSSKIEALMNETLLFFTDFQLAQNYLENVKKEKPRYVRDQLIAIKNCIKEQDPSVIHQTLKYCNENKFYIATDFIDIFKFFNSKVKAIIVENTCQLLNPMDDDIIRKLNFKPEIRSMEVYKAALKKYVH